MKILYRTAALLCLAIGAAAGADADPTALLKAGKADEALHTLNATLAHDPNDARAYHLLSRVYFHLELWDNSVAIISRRP